MYLCDSPVVQGGHGARLLARAVELGVRLGARGVVDLRGAAGVCVQGGGGG